MSMPININYSIIITASQQKWITSQELSWRIDLVQITSRWYTIIIIMNIIG